MQTKADRFFEDYRKSIIMEITEELITDLNGEYFKEGIKKTFPSGALIIQNSYGITEKNNIKFIFIVLITR
jgi:hypothetical protein